MLTKVKLGLAALAVSATVGTALQATTAPTAEADGAQLWNGLISTTGCLIPTYQVAQTCSDLELLTGRPPVILNLNPAGTRIVVLGARLNNNGKVPRVLIPRLQAALALARGFPMSSIITTGGMTNRRAGRSEARAMKDWLVKHGVSARRIATENRSTSTAENAKFVAPMLWRGRAGGVTVVTSANHLRRSLISFRTAVRGSMPVEGVIPGAGNTSGSSSGGLGSMGSS
ncbi:MAG: YdcF family protein [Gordonia sp. (in: high G+C Gram-positive bacteria)]|uniref:YdcF family protein n=1 Tax=Gordonia sp. (in: high G+C Gram-positive bacteria) TaxID=84139 RepID=UPI0039E5E202